VDQLGQALDIDQLGSFSKRLASAIFEDFPSFADHARMTKLSEPDGFSLLVEFPSPTLDDSRSLHICVDEAVTPSFGFGPDHTHGSPDDAGVQEILHLTHAVLDDRLLIATDVGGQNNGHRAWLDTRDPTAMLSELTSPHSPGTIIIQSFSGDADRTVRLSDLAE
jgi:hypothetical protein